MTSSRPSREGLIDATNRTKRTQRPLTLSADFDTYNLVGGGGARITGSAAAWSRWNQPQGDREKCIENVYLGRMF